MEEQNRLRAIVCSDGLPTVSVNLRKAELIKVGVDESDIVVYSESKMTKEDLAKIVSGWGDSQVVVPGCRVDEYSFGRIMRAYKADEGSMVVIGSNGGVAMRPASGFEWAPRRRSYDVRVVRAGVILDRLGVAVEPVIEPVRAGLPEVLPVVFLTYERTAVARYCLCALCENLKYSGRIHFILCDDMSGTGHVEALERVLSEYGISDFSTCRTDESRHGLGASMNNGLDVAFSMSDVVLTTEDDFMLCEPLDMDRYVSTVLRDGVAGVRLAYLRTKPVKGGRIISRAEKSGYPGYYKVVGDSRQHPGHVNYVFNNQVMLRHRRVYDLVGRYSENVSTDVAEDDMAMKYDKATNSGHSAECQVLYPTSLRLDTLDNGLFRHIGASTVGHSYMVPSAFKWMNSPAADAAARVIGGQCAVDGDESVTYVCDDGAVELLAVSAFSLLRASRAFGGNVHVNVLCPQESSDKVGAVAYALGKRFGSGSMSVIVLPRHVVEKCDRENSVTRSLKVASATSIALSKFEIPRIVPGSKTLFLDCDTLVMGDVSDILSIEIPSGAKVAAVRDIGYVVGRNDRRGDRRYFNSGVMLMDLEAMRGSGCSELLWEAKAGERDQTLVDQNAFNTVFHDALLIGPENNALVCEYASAVKGFGEDCVLQKLNELYGTKRTSVFGCCNSFVGTARILHYAGSGKPWSDNPIKHQCVSEWTRMKNCMLSEVVGLADILRRP